MADYDKIEVDGEILYVDKETGETRRKMSKEEFKEKMLEEQVKRRKEFNKKAQEQWQEEQEAENKRLNKHIKAESKSTGTSKKEKNVFTARFEKMFADKKMQFVNIGNTESGVNYGGNHYSVKVTKKTTALTAFENVKGKTTDKEKEKIYNILLEVITEQTAMIKNELFVRTENGDFLVKLTKKKDGIAGL